MIHVDDRPTGTCNECRQRCWLTEEGKVPAHPSTTEVITVFNHDPFAPDCAGSDGLPLEQLPPRPTA